MAMSDEALEAILSDNCISVLVAEIRRHRRAIEGLAELTRREHDPRCPNAPGSNCLCGAEEHNARVRAIVEGE